MFNINKAELISFTEGRSNGFDVYLIIYEDKNGLFQLEQFLSEGKAREFIKKMFETNGQKIRLEKAS